MQLAKVIGRVFCTRQFEAMEGKRLLLIQPLGWEKEEPCGDPIVAADVVGSGASEKVFFVAAREAAVAFASAKAGEPGLPPVDAVVVGIVEGHHVRNFRKKV